MPDINNNVETIRSYVGGTHVMGNLTLASGTLEIDVASGTMTDLVAVDGQLMLGGDLSVVLDDGYVPAAGTMWVIGTADGIGGSFAGVTPGFGVEVSGRTLVLLAVPEVGTLGVMVAGVVGLMTKRRGIR